MEAIKLRYEEPRKNQVSSALEFLNRLGRQRFKQSFLIESQNENQMNAIAQNISEYRIEDRKLIFPEKGLFLVVENEKYIIPVFHLVLQHIKNILQEDKKLNSYESCDTKSLTWEICSTRKISNQLILKNPHEILKPYTKEKEILFLSEFAREEVVKLVNYNKLDFVPYILSERHYQSKIFNRTITYISTLKPEFTADQFATKKESHIVIQSLVNRYDKQTIELLGDLCDFVFLDNSFKVRY